MYPRVIALYCIKVVRIAGQLISFLVIFATADVLLSSRTVQELGAFVRHETFTPTFFCFSFQYVTVRLATQEARRSPLSPIFHQSSSSSKENSGTTSTRATMTLDSTASSAGSKRTRTVSSSDEKPPSKKMKTQASGFVSQ